MLILNLGCGTKTCSHPDVVNIDWSIYLRLKSSKLLSTVVPFILSKERRQRFKNLPNNVMVHNLARGIPFNSNSVDVVYHSHMLEHLDRDVVEGFLLEVKRVLKAGGIHRIVVPDLEMACRAYIAHIAKCDADSTQWDKHDIFVASIIEQSVRKEGFGARQQTPFWRFIENQIVGDARKRGETHQWMYDRINLSAILKQLGYQEILLQKYNTSLVHDWEKYGLDIDEQGDQYKPESMYLEAVK